MAKYYVLVVALAALVALQGCAAKPKAKQAAPQEKSQLEELAANTKILVNNVTQALGIKDIPDTKKAAEIFNNNVQTLATHVQEIADKVKGELKAHQGDVDSVLKSIEKKLTETATSLQQAAGPEATAKAKEIKANLDSGLKTAVDQVQKLVKAVEPDATKAKSDIQTAAQTFLNQITDISNNLKSQLDATVEEHEKSHKKH